MENQDLILNITGYNFRISRFCLSLLQRLVLSERDFYAGIPDIANKLHKMESDWIAVNRKFHINVISSAAKGKLKETAHSKILHDLLHNSVILSSFLNNILEIEDIFFSTENIESPDRDRIDLSLRSEEKFLIIENKVNSAEEQEGQLYRYCNIAKETHADENIIILYLNPDSYEAPSLYSRSKDGTGAENDPDTVKTDRIIIKNYKTDILNWLHTIKDNTDIVNDSEPYLKSAILQYIDYLEEYFQVKDEFKNLHIMLESEIKNLFGINDSMPITTQINILEEASSNLERMKSEVDQLKTKLHNEQKKVEFKKILEDEMRAMSDEFQGKIAFKMFDYKNPEGGFNVKMEDILLFVSALLDVDGSYYWRIYSNKKLDAEKRERLANLLTPIVGAPAIKSDKDKWDVYKQTEKENACSICLRNLAEIFLKEQNFIVH